MENFIVWLGLAGAVLMPLWNIPLILRIRKRRSSEDISLTWVLGVWFCILLMFPSALISEDAVLKAFGLINAVMFSFVVITVLAYRKKQKIGDTGTP